MQPLKIFISSVQKEFSMERRWLCDYIRQDALLGKFFVPFIFEEMPAADLSAQEAYLNEVEQSDIYLGLLGERYGYEDRSGMSPTEKEYDKASAESKYRLIFIRKTDYVELEPKQQDFIDKAQSVVVRKTFSDYEELRSGVYAALVHYLEHKEYLRILPFDTTLNRATLEDIDDRKIADFLHIAKQRRGIPLPIGASTEIVLTHLDLMSPEGRLTNAAILLFGKQPQRFFISSEVKCVQFYGTEVTKPIPSYQVYRGDVFQLITQAVDFVMSRIDARVSSRDTSTQVNVDYELPLAAVTEAIVNAIAHRDYASNGSVQVMLFKNRLEIWNPGSLPVGLTIEKLHKPHPSLPTNPLLANPMYLAGNIERIGTGTGDIISKCKDAGLDIPKFIQDEDFKVIIWRHEDETEQPNDRVDDRPNDRVDDRPNDRVVINLNEKQEAVLAFCREPHSSREILKHISTKYHPNAINIYITKLVDAQLLQMAYPNNPTHPRQVYSLTEKGAKLLS